MRNSLSRMPFMRTARPTVAECSRALSTGPPQRCPHPQICSSRRSACTSDQPRRAACRSRAERLRSRWQHCRKTPRSSVAPLARIRAHGSQRPPSDPPPSSSGAVASSPRCLKRRSSPRFNHIPSQLGQRSMRASGGNAGSRKRYMRARQRGQQHGGHPSIGAGTVLPGSH